MQVSSFHFGPHHTPKVLKGFILLLAGLAILSPLVTFFMHYFLHMHGPQEWLALSSMGLHRGWFWEPLTYIFIHSTTSEISLSLFIKVAFYLFLLWFTGAEIFVRFGRLKFFLLFFSSALFAGLVCTVIFFLFKSSEIVVGSSPAIFSLLTVWTLFYPEMKFHFLFFFRLEAKWIVALIIGISLLMSLSAGAFLSFIADASGIIWGYFFGRTILKLPSPFSFSFSKPLKKGKIIDISSYQAEDDEAFMDRMLEKIAKKGETSLSQAEKKRMQEISKNRR